MIRKLTMAELNRLSPEEFKNAPKLPVVLVLDNVRSLHNVGSIFRTADAFNIESILLCGITATPPHREIHRSALGAEESVRWHYAENTPDGIRELKKKGYHIIAIEQTTHSTPLGKRDAGIFGYPIPPAPFPRKGRGRRKPLPFWGGVGEGCSSGSGIRESSQKPIEAKRRSRFSGTALILGNEIHGISDEVLLLADEAIEIPQFGTKHSFNVAVTAGIVLWELCGKK